MRGKRKMGAEMERGREKCTDGGEWKCWGNINRAKRR